jgi:hypothetical protein
MELKASQYFVSKILTLYEVVLCILTENGRLCFTHWTNSEALILLAKGFSDEGTPGVAKHVGRKPCINCFFFLVQEKMDKQI